ncbi:MAG: hypothetical protein ACXW32_08430 [Limisphaerales bacterium]
MKSIVVFLPLLFIGCASPERNRQESSASHAVNPAASAPATAPATAAQLITTFGEHRFGNTIVEIDRTERKFTVKHLSSKEFPGGKSTSTSAMSPPPDQWPLHDGWFAYTHQNGAYVWLHNGAGGLLLVERQESEASNATNTYGTNHFPIPIPSTVLHNLQEPLRSKLQKN